MVDLDWRGLVVWSTRHYVQRVLIAELFVYVLQSSVRSSKFGLTWKKHMLELVRFKSSSKYLSARASATAKGTISGIYVGYESVA